MMPSHDMNSFSFVIPEFNESDWRNAIEAAEGFDQKLLICRAKVMSLRTSIKDQQVTPALLAWVNLWSKCLLILDGAQSAWSGNSSFTLDILGRVSTENWLHVFTILERDKASASNDRERMHGRLCAYTAWTLSEDKQRNWELSKKQMLDMVWDPKPAQNIKYNPEALAFHETNFGELTIDTDPGSLRIDRKKHEEQIRHERDRLDTWLRHPDLKEWITKIRALKETMKPQSVPFFALFNIEEKSVAKKMRKAGFGLGYHSYKQSSSLIHGSTIELLNLTMDNKVIPKTFLSDNDIDAKADMIYSTCNAVRLMLALIQKMVWSEKAKK